MLEWKHMIEHTFLNKCITAISEWAWKRIHNIFGFLVFVNSYRTNRQLEQILGTTQKNCITYPWKLKMKRRDTLNGILWEALTNHSHYNCHFLQTQPKETKILSLAISIVKKTGLDTIYTLNGIDNKTSKITNITVQQPKLQSISTYNGILGRLCA